IMPGFRNMIRAICSVAAQAGSGSGGALATILIEPAEPQRALQDWIIGVAFPDLLARPGIVSTQLWIADNAETPHTREKELRSAKDGTIEWALVVEAIEIEPLETALESLLSRDSTLVRFSRAMPRRSLYRHIFTLDADRPLVKSPRAISGTP